MREDLVYALVLHLTGSSLNKITYSIYTHSDDDLCVVRLETLHLLKGGT